VPERDAHGRHQRAAGFEVDHGQLALMACVAIV
jgi:hypothetical protein